MKPCPYDGYFWAHDYVEMDDNGRPIDRKRVFNVAGKFADHQILDGAATREVSGSERVMKIVTVLLERILKDVAGSDSKDETVTKVDPQNQDVLITRYPEAWASYKSKKRPTRKKGAIVELRSVRGR